MAWTHFAGYCLFLSISLPDNPGLIEKSVLSLLQRSTHFDVNNPTPPAQTFLVTACSLVFGASWVCSRHSPESPWRQLIKQVLCHGLLFVQDTTKMLIFQWIWRKDQGKGSVLIWGPVTETWECFFSFWEKLFLMGKDLRHPWGWQGQRLGQQQSDAGSQTRSILSD